MPIIDSVTTKKEYNVLLVDDEKNVLNSLKRLFRKEPYNLILATTAEEGIEKLSEMEFQVIMSDYRMPGKNGVEFLKEVKKICPESIRMLLSGYADIDAIIKAVNEGEIYKFLTKPWNDDELKITVKRAVEQYELQKENMTLTRKLKSLNKSLEEKVEARTKELKMRNDVLLLSQEVMERLPFSVIGVDRDGIITLVNRKGAELFPDGDYFLGEIIECRLPSEIVDLMQGKDAEQQAVEIQGLEINGREYSARLSPLGSKGHIRGSVLTFLEY